MNMNFYAPTRSNRAIRLSLPNYFKVAPLKQCHADSLHCNINFLDT